MITEFRECFYLYARSGQIRTLDELTIIMRSLGMSPTIFELKKYLKERSTYYAYVRLHNVAIHLVQVSFYINVNMLVSDGKISFPEFLKVMHTHSQVEKLPKEVVDAFRASDSAKNGLITAKHLRHLLLNWGEQLSGREGTSTYQLFTYVHVF